MSDPVNSASSVDDANARFYESLYSEKNSFIHWLHGRLSFNQHSKNHPNLLAARPLFSEWRQRKYRPKVLDYGCGWGLFLQHIPREADAYCFDLSANAMAGVESVMRILRRRVSRARFDQGEIYPREFDLILCSHVMEHVEDDFLLMRALARALRPGGYLLVNVPINEVRADPRHARTYSVAALRERLVGAGLEPRCEWQADRLGGPLARLDISGSRVWRIVRGASRAALALMPYAIVRFLENAFFRAEPFHQLIVLAQKPVMPQDGKETGERRE